MTSTYQEQVCTTIRRLKAEPAGGRTVLPVLLEGKQIARLEPVGWQDADAPESIRLLAQWREAAANAFPAVFPVTLDGTKRWLVQQLLELPDRLLLWVLSPEGTKIGHVGLFRFDFAARHVELDNIVRGVPGVAPGVMEASVRALIDWTFVHLDARDVYLRVFSDNPRAIHLYERCGFLETMRMPLKREVEGEVTRWLEIDGTYRGLVSRYFVTMQLPRMVWTANHRAVNHGAAKAAA